MDGQLPTIATMFTDTAGSLALPSESGTRMKTGSFCSGPVDSARSTNGEKGHKTDNINRGASDNLTGPSPQHFANVLNRQANSHSRPGDAAQAGRQQIRQQRAGETKAKTLSPIPPGAVVFNTPLSAVAHNLHELRGAIETLKPSMGTILLNAGWIQATGSNLFNTALLTKNHRPAGLKPALAHIAQDLAHAQSKQQNTKTSLSPTSPDRSQATMKLPPQNAKPTGQTSQGEAKPPIFNVLAASTTRKEPSSENSLELIQAKAADAKKQPVKSPEKPTIVAENPNHNKRGGSSVSPESLTGKDQGSSPSGNVAHRMADHMNSKSSSEQTKDPGDFQSRRRGAPNIDQAASSNNAQVILSEPPSASAAKTANNAPPANAGADIAQQITESIQGSLRPGDRQITILLHPPELGKVVVRFKEEQDQVTGLLEVSKAETRYEIEQVLPQITRTLQDLGVHVRRLEVQLSEQMERQANRDASPDDGSFHQQSPGEGDNSDNRGTYEWLLNAFGQAYQDDFETPWPLSEQSINMLM